MESNTTVYDRYKNVLNLENHFIKEKKYYLK